MKTILPGATIGILGGGQLGRMLAMEARHMGYRTVVLDATAGCPAAQVADEHIQAPVDDMTAALQLARQSDVVTLEWELIPAPILAAIEKIKTLYPSSHVLHIIQDRLTQKNFLAKHDFPQAVFADVGNSAQLKEAIQKIGFPCILKRRHAGYDGKGQLLLKNKGGLSQATDLLKAPCVLEVKVPFVKEVSVILARRQDGAISFYPVAENVHRRGILHMTIVPARVPTKVQEKAKKLAAQIAKALGHVGVMAVEMFLLKDGTLLVNEIAPRVHNSGHYSLGACATSQFEQHLRAVCGLGLGNTDLLSPAVMVNLLGDLWNHGDPNWEPLLRRPNLKLHLYGKVKAAPGRKMGHILVLDRNTKQLISEAEKLLKNLNPSFKN